MSRLFCSAGLLAATLLVACVFDSTGLTPQKPEERREASTAIDRSQPPGDVSSEARDRSWRDAPADTARPDRAASDTRRPDAPRPDQRRDAPRPDQRRDAPRPDQRRDTLRPDTTRTCDQRYGGAVPGYLACPNMAVASCRFYFAMPSTVTQTTCSYLCQQGGGTCLSAENDLNNGCQPMAGSPINCAGLHNDGICECTL